MDFNLLKGGKKMEITIKTITNKTSKTGTPFWVVDAVEGKYTVWDKEISEQLYTTIGQKVEVDVKMSGDFANIRGVVGGNITPKAERIEVNPSEKRVASAPSSRDSSIVAQCLTKIEFRNHADPKPLDILESYRFYLKELDG